MSGHLRNFTEYGCGRQESNHVLCRMDIDANPDDFADEENYSDEDADTDDEVSINTIHKTNIKIYNK